METNDRPFIRRDGINWISLTAFTIFHVGAIAALFFFTWPAFFTALALYWISLSFGIGMGYHRLLTHRSYETPKWIEYFLATCGALALEGGPMFWVATHRIHHQFADQDGDPHTPRDGKWWSHIGWMLVGDGTHCDIEQCSHYAPDICKDRYLVWLSKYHYVPLAILSILLLSFGGLPFLLWGVFFRVTMGLHATWMVNSLPAVCHSGWLTEQLAGGPVEFRRGVAQQSPRLSNIGPAWARLVRNRHELVGDPTFTGDRFGHVCAPRQPTVQAAACKQAC